jgi:hypothetical protein
MTATSRSEKTVLLGAEYDPEVWSAVLQALKDLGATELGKTWQAAGSQELQRVEARLRSRTVIVEGETYGGLSITGESGLIAEITALVRSRLPHSPLSW